MSATRRDVLAAATVPFAGELAPLLRRAPADADAELLALREPYERTLAELDRICGWHSPFEDAYFTLLQDNPGMDHKLAARATRFDKAEAVQGDASLANLAVIEQIAATPARTLAGLRFKAEISRRESHGVPELLEAIADDCANL